jgi:pimeloyl-ACP methyl ester carboxylesterase
MEAKAKPRKAPKELSFENIDNGILRLRTKPTSKLAYSFVPAHDHPESVTRPNTAGGSPLLIFLSGIDNSKAIWQKTLDRLFESACAIGAELPPMLFYDRFGVGGSDPEPSDVGKKPEEFHNCADAVKDLHQVVVQLMELKFGWSRHVDQSLRQDLPRIVFCAHSVGVCVARMFADAYPGVVQGILMLDSAIATKQAEDIIPDPNDPLQWAGRRDPQTAWGRFGFPDENVLSKDAIKDARQKVRRSPISGYAMTSKEQMRWDHMPEQLPRADEPKLRGPTEHLPLITVMARDPEVLAQQHGRVSLAHIEDDTGPDADVAYSF